LIYGLQTPTGSLSFTNVAQTLAGSVPNTAGMTPDQIAYANATTRVNDVSGIKTNSFNVTLRTNKGYAAGNTNYRDADADGDNAILRMDGGVDVNGTGTVDYRTPGTTGYGFDEFTTLHQPGLTSADNTGTYTQTIDASQL